MTFPRRYTSLPLSAHQHITTLRTTTMQYPVYLSEHVRDTDTANPELVVVTFPSPPFSIVEHGPTLYELILGKALWQHAIGPLSDIRPVQAGYTYEK